MSELLLLAFLLNTFHPLDRRRIMIKPPRVIYCHYAFSFRAFAFLLAFSLDPHSRFRKLDFRSMSELLLLGDRTHLHWLKPLDVPPHPILISQISKWYYIYLVFWV